MQLLDLTLPTPAENLALDEAILEQAEQQQEPAEIFRLWESPVPLVVIGRASKMKEEVNLQACQKQQIPTMRRISGGAAVTAGPGCLMYAVVLSYKHHPDLVALDLCHQYVMGKMRDAVAQLVPDVKLQGTCDLTWQGRKFSGNSLRCKRSHFIYHGTILYDFDLSLIQSLLRTPPRMPDYRDQRSHESFVTNLPIQRSNLRQCLIQTWQANELANDWPEQQTAELARQKYQSSEWNFQR